MKMWREKKRKQKGEKGAIGVRDSHRTASTCRPALRYILSGIFPTFPGDPRIASGAMGARIKTAAQKKARWVGGPPFNPAAVWARLPRCIDLPRPDYTAHIWKRESRAELKSISNNGKREGKGAIYGGTRRRKTSSKL